MDAREIASCIRLHPRATVLVGRIEPRTKNGGALPGLTPHYAQQGCPVVRYAGAAATSEDCAAEIEFMFEERDFPLPSALGAFNTKRGSLVQLMFGAAGKAPSQPAYRVLREASEVLTGLVRNRIDVFLAAFPIMTPGKFGVPSGRYYFLGLFDSDGDGIYLNPDAVADGILDAPFPGRQTERVASTSASKDGDWYQRLSDALSGVAGLEGERLRDAILAARASELVREGLVASLNDGVARARHDLPPL